MLKFSVKRVPFLPIQDLATLCNAEVKFPRLHSHYAARASDLALAQEATE